MHPHSLEGDLGLGTFPWLLGKLHNEQSTGVLRVVSDGVERSVYVKWGVVLFASSRFPEDRLDQRLLKEERATRSSIERAYDRAKASGARFGECLIELGALTEEELHAAVERQVRSIIQFLFSVSRGRFWFEPAAENAEPVDLDLMLHLPMQQILLDGIRSMTDPLALRLAVGPMMDVLQIDRTASESEIPFKPSEAFLLYRIDGRSSVLDLLAISPFDEVESLRALAALVSVGIAKAS
jgi:hypothetical protein